MKKLLLITLLIPAISFGQRFEVSEQAGTDLGNNKFALSNAVAFGYHSLKHFSISAFYELSLWNLQGDAPTEGPATVKDALYDVNNHAFGIAPEVDFRNFFAGIDAKVVYLKDYGTTWGFNRSFDPSVGGGIHVGSKQKITKHLYFAEQIGYETISVKGTQFNPIGSGSQSTFTQSMNYSYLHVGLSYKL